MKVKVGNRARHYRTVTFDSRNNAVRLIEQRLLPHSFKIVALPDYRATAKAIRDMVVRGAPAIAATAAFGLAQGACAFRGKDLHRFEAHMEKVFVALKSARPTAIDPVNAMSRIRRLMKTGASVSECQAIALREAKTFADEDVEHCRAIGCEGAKLIRSGARILTHCNAGWLACVDIGTATAPMYEAQARGTAFHVYCDETRPRSQGSILTAWELAQQGVSHDVIADNAAGHLMQRGKIDLIITGSDRTLGRTGEVANKIGTYTKAVLAQRHGIPFYVAIPLSTIDWDLRDGMEIPIEERDRNEVMGAWGLTKRGTRDYVLVGNAMSSAQNPAFDVTGPDLITGIITPVGIFKPKDLWRNRTRLEYRDEDE